MLRLIFVFGIILVGAFYSLQGAFYALLFYLWYAYFRPEYWVWNDVIWSLRLSLFIGSFLVISAIPHLHKFKWNRQVALLVLFFLQATISLITSQYYDRIFDFWVEFLKVILVSILITVLVDDERRFRLTLLIVALSLGFEAAKQGWAQFVLNPGATNNNPHVMLGDNNGVALGMMMLIPIFLALAETSKSIVERNIHRFFIAGVFYRAISTYSRGGFIAAGVVSFVSLWRSQHKVRTLVGAAVLVYAVSAVMPQSFWDRMNSITAPADERDSSAASRLHFWGLAEDMAADHPLTGVGFNGFRYAYDSYDRRSGGEGGGRAVHSVWFGTLSELGYPGLVIFIALLAGSILSCHRTRKRAKKEGKKTIAIYAAHLQTSFVVFIVGGTFLNAQYVELLWHFVALGVALERIAAAEPVAVVEPVLPARPSTTPVMVTPRYAPRSAQMRPR